MFLERSYGRVDEHRLVANDLERDTRRKRLLDLLEFLFYRFDDLDGVRARLPPHVERHGLLAFDHVPGARLGEAVFHAANIAHANRRAVDVGDYDVTELAYRIDSSERANAELRFASNDPAAGNLDVLVLNRALKLADGDAVRIKLLCVGEHSYLSLASAGHADFSDA